MHCTFDTPPPKKKKKSRECRAPGVRSLSYVDADPSLRSPLLAPPLLPAAVGLPSLPRSLLGVGGGRSHRGRVARETSACVRVCVCQRASERGSPGLETKGHARTHARSRFPQTFTHSGRVVGHRKERRKPPYARGKLRSFFFFFFGGGWCCVAARAAPRRIHWPELDRGSPRRSSAYPEGPWRIKGFPRPFLASDTLFLFSRLSFLVRTGMRRQL